MADLPGGGSNYRLGRKPTRFQSLSVPDTATAVALAAWLGVVGLCAWVGGSMMFHALTGLDRTQDRLAHHGAHVSALLTTCHLTPGTRSRRDCTLRYSYAGRSFSKVVANRDAQFRGLQQFLSEIVLLVDREHPTTAFTTYDVENRGGDWQRRIAIGAIVLAFGLLILGAPLLADFV